MNTFLNSSDSPACSVCNQDTETIEHLFADCFHVRDIWHYFEEWLRSKFNFLINKLYVLVNSKIELCIDYKTY